LAVWTRIGAVWDHDDGEGMQLELVPVNGGRIVLRTPKDEANDQEDDMQRYIVKFVEVRHYEMTVNTIDVKRRSGTRRTGRTIPSGSKLSWNASRQKRSQRKRVIADRL
jgi:hypothetical protein